MCRPRGRARECCERGESRELLLERGEKIECFQRLEVVEIGGAQRVEDFLIDGREHHGLGRRRGGGRKFLGDVALAPFVFGKNLAGARDDRSGQSGETGDFDAIAFVGGARLDVAQKNDFAAGFANRDVNVFHAGEQAFEFGEFMIVRGKDRAGSGVFMKMLDDRQAMERPSKVAVPRPTSSSRTRLAGVAVLRMAATSLISTRNVERPRARLSEAPMRVKMRSTRGKRASVAGTKLPICAMMTMSAAWRRYVDFPPMLGPVMSRID